MKKIAINEKIVRARPRAGDIMAVDPSVKPRANRKKSGFILLFPYVFKVSDCFKEIIGEGNESHCIG
jgi:hypothetical protein